MENVVLDNTKKNKLDIRMKSIIICSVINTIIGVFSGSFLVANLYNTNSNPIVTIASYYLLDYFALLLFYFILAHFGENVKIREWVYRIGILLKTLFIFLIVILNDNFQSYIYIFAILSGMADAFYWSSYSLMRYSIVKRSMINKFTLIEQLLGKTANILVPIILGSFIDVASFVKVAFPVLIFATIQFIFSFFVKSNEVTKAKFSLINFWKKIKREENTKYFRKIYFSFFVDGTRSAIGTVITIFIMTLFNGSNTSLGIISSIISVGCMFFLLVYTQYKSVQRSKLTYSFMIILPILACLGLIFYPSKITLILYNLCFNASSDLMTYGLDTNRISMVKILKYHGETLEHNVTAEIHLDFGRYISYTIMLLIGIFAGENVIFLLSLSLIFYISMFIIVNIINYKLSKEYQIMLDKHNKEKFLNEQKLKEENASKL